MSLNGDLISETQSHFHTFVSALTSAYPHILSPLITSARSHVCGNRAESGPGSRFIEAVPSAISASSFRVCPPPLWPPRERRDGTGYGGRGWPGTGRATPASCEAKGGYRSPRFTRGYSVPSVTGACLCAQVT
ncbi:hypothetical protein AAFF_G00394610 [Aldrovandia affinis]|uniref:Uncharacterized protein n=1 Tax=Aldrovandia affinis TaxID=143900 RepID=A0AAD7WKY2_9TELE|nr:hypothetical protein AAFF_G00394610 [Aldrovandia affinis]